MKMDEALNPSTFNLLFLLLFSLLVLPSNLHSFELKTPTQIDACRTHLAGLPLNDWYQHSRYPAHLKLSNADIEKLKSGLEVAIGGFYGRTFSEYIAALKPKGFDPKAYKNKRLVDIGCGASNFIDVMANEFQAEAFGIDIAYSERSPIGQGIKKNVPDEINYMQGRGVDFSRLKYRIGASATNLPFEDNSVDAIVSIIAITYLDEKPHQIALLEILRVLKPGGKFFAPDALSERYLDLWKIPKDKLNNYIKPAWFNINKIQFVSSK